MIQWKQIYLLVVGVVVALTGNLFAAASLIVDQYDADSTFGTGEAQQITFAQEFDDTPLVFAIATDAGGDAAMIRVFDVTKSGFKSVIVEPRSFDGSHVDMTNVTYIAVSEGQVVLPDGTTIYAGKVNTHRGQGKGSVFTNTSYETISYDPGASSDPFAGNPTLLTNLQTVNNAVEPAAGEEYTALGVRAPFLAVATNNVGTGEFDVALERLETGTGDVEFLDATNELVDETIGWLAVEQGQGSFTVDGTEILYDFSVFDLAVDGWDDGGEVVEFNQDFENDDVLVTAQTNTRRGPDGGFIRSGDVDQNGVQLFIDEDTFSDNERSHTKETVSVAAFSSAFILVPEPSSFVLIALSSVLFFSRKRRNG